MALSRYRRSIDISTEASGTASVEDWALNETLHLRGRRPIRVVRIDIDYTNVNAAAPAFEVQDQDGVALAASGDEGSPVYLWTYDTSGNGPGGTVAFKEGTVCASVVLDLADYKEGDVPVFDIWYEHSE